MTDRQRLMVAKLAEQDRFWMEYDAWYADQDRQAMLELIDHIDIEPEDGPQAMRTLDDHGAELCRRFALHVFRELALRSERGLLNATSD